MKIAILSMLIILATVSSAISRLAKPYYEEIHLNVSSTLVNISTDENNTVIVDVKKTEGYMPELVESYDSYHVIFKRRIEI